MRSQLSIRMQSHSMLFRTETCFVNCFSWCLHDGRVMAQLFHECYTHAAAASVARLALRAVHVDTARPAFPNCRTVSFYHRKLCPIAPCGSLSLLPPERVRFCPSAHADTARHRISSLRLAPRALNDPSLPLRARAHSLMTSLSFF